MDCYFGAYELPAEHDNAQAAIVTFHIPDVGIKFKAPFKGVNVDHCDFASLLALLEFIDSNQKYFSNLPNSFSPLMEKAKNYRDKYRFSLEWIPTSENSAYDPLLD